EHIIKRVARTWWNELTGSRSSVLSPYDMSGGRLNREFRLLLQELTSRRPLLLFIDDLQWCDDSTLALLSHVARLHGSLRLLVVGTVRIRDVSPDSFLLQMKRELHDR